MSEKTKTWLRFAGMRALKTVAQTAVATIGTAAVMDEVNWVMVLSASVLAGILSLLTSVAGIPEADYDEYLSDSKEAVYYEDDDDDDPEDEE